MLNDQELYNQLNNYIDENYIVFDKESYKIVLEEKLNDSTFIKEYIFSDCQSSGSDLLELLQALTKELDINLAKGINVANDYINVSENKNKIEKARNSLNNIRMRIEEETIEFSSSNVDEIKEIIREEEYILEGIDSSSLQDKNKKEYEEVIDLKNKLRFDIDNIFKNYLDDVTYESTITRLFKNNSVWLTNYGNYNYNPYLSIQRLEDESNIQFEKLAKCEFLSGTFARRQIFSPLVHGDKLFISEDGRSITIIDNNGRKRIELNDDIAFSGTIMYLKIDRFLIVPCKSAIKIIDIINGQRVVESLSYSVSSDDYEIKSIVSFNNYCYLNISDYKNDTSILIRLMYYNKFVLRRKNINRRILSNLSLVYDNYDSKVKLYCIDIDGALINLDINSLDEIGNKYKLKDLPIDRYYTKGNLKIRYSYPIISYDEKLYYQTISKDDSLRFNIIDIKGDELERSIELPKYHNKTQTGDILPSFSNIVINGEKAVIIGPFAKKMSSLKYNFKNCKVTESDDFKDLYAKNVFAILNNDNLISVNDKFEMENKQFSRIVCIWEKRIVVLEEKPNDNNYTLYIETKR